MFPCYFYSRYAIAGAGAWADAALPLLLKISSFAVEHLIHEKVLSEKAAEKATAEAQAASGGASGVGGASGAQLESKRRGWRKRR